MPSFKDNLESPAPASLLKAIDVHAHYGRCDRPERPLTTQLMSADAATVPATGPATSVTVLLSAAGADAARKGRCRRGKR